MEKPVLVETVRIERIPIPEDLLIRHQKTDIPESITWGEGAVLWSMDRAIIDILLGQIRAIESLNEVSDGLEQD